MAKISVQVGVTMHVGAPTNNEFARYYIGIDDIDCDQPLEPQLQNVATAYPQVLAFAEQRLTTKIQEALSSQ